MNRALSRRTYHLLSFFAHTNVTPPKITFATEKQSAKSLVYVMQSKERDTDLNFVSIQFYKLVSRFEIQTDDMTKAVKLCHLKPVPQCQKM
jgi:hypothetical protein